MALLVPNCLRWLYQSSRWVKRAIYKCFYRAFLFIGTICFLNNFFQQKPIVSKFQTLNLEYLPFFFPKISSKNIVNLLKYGSLYFVRIFHIKLCCLQRFHCLHGFKMCILCKKCHLPNKKQKNLLLSYNLKQKFQGNRNFLKFHFWDPSIENAITKDPLEMIIKI